MGCRYEDDKDEGEWFLYTGSGGRDLSGNKRVNSVSPCPATLPPFRPSLCCAVLKQARTTM